MLNENIDGKWICNIADSEYWRSTEHFDTKEDALRGLENALESYKILLVFLHFSTFYIAESDAVKRNAKNLGTTAKRGKLISKHLQGRDLTLTRF